MPSVLTPAGSIALNPTQFAVAAGVVSILSTGGIPNAGTTDVTVTGGDSFVTKTVTGQAWVSSSSTIAASVIDHPSGVSAEEAAAEGVTVRVGNLVAATGFDVYLNIPDGGVGPYRVAFFGA